MTNLESRIRNRERELKALYDPKKAFGNAELIRLMDGIEEDKKFLEEHDVCAECDGCGKVEVDCRECSGEGFIKK